MDEPKTHSDHGTRIAEITLSLDFDKMWESVVDKDWGGWGDRPASFEEYVCYLVAEKFKEDISWNQYRTSEAMDTIKRHIDEVGLARAEKAARDAEAGYLRAGKVENAGVHRYNRDTDRWEHISVDEYYAERLAEHTRSAIDRKAHAAAQLAAGDSDD